MMTRTRGLCRLEAKPAMKKATGSKRATSSKVPKKKNGNKDSTAGTMLINIKPPKAELTENFSNLMRFESFRPLDHEVLNHHTITYLYISRLDNNFV